MTDKIQAAADELKDQFHDGADVLRCGPGDESITIESVLQKHFGADLERLGLLRTCNECGLLYDRANGGTCKCGVQRIKDAAQKVVARYDAMPDLDTGYLAALREELKR